MKLFTSNNTMTQKSSGFTLLEIMVVIAIISMVSVATISTYLRGNAYRRVRTASRELYAGFREASTQAVNRSENITITFDLAAESYSITDSNNVEIASHNFSEFVDVYAVTPAAGSFTYNSRGMGQSGRVRIQYSFDNNLVTRMGVRTTSAGGISIIDEKDANWL